MRVLIVDDEKQLTSALSVILKQNNFSVDTADNGEDGLDMILNDNYDVIVLDIMMPKIDGLSVLKYARQHKISTPILMLSAKSETQDKITGLTLGADDYLSKPFDAKELIARIKALTRRKSEFTGNIIEYNDIKLNRDNYELSCGQHTISIGKKEFQLLEILMLNNGKSVLKERLIEKIWGFESEAEYNTIEVYVSFLRKKLSAIKSKTEIKSIRGVGYMLGEENG